jgi:NAD(P)H-nitrite reductase large subunit
VKYLVLGDGIAGSTAAKTLASGNDHEVTVLTDEERPLYNRILLKTYMSGKHPVDISSVHTKDWYDDKGIELKLDTKALSVDTSEKTVLTSGGEISYDKMLVATGGSPKAFPLDEGYDNFYYMWNWDSAERIKQAAESSQTAVVIGGGLLGIDLAIAFAAHGCKTHYLIREGNWWSKGLDKKTADKVHRRLEKKGVDVHLNSEATKLESEDGKVNKVVYENASGEISEIQVDSVAAAIGQKPNTDFVDVEKDSDGRIKTSAELQTSDPDIYAAGNTVKYRSVLFDRHTVHGSWDHSREMGKKAALNMLGSEDAGVFRYVNSYGVGHFDKEIQALGDWSGSVTRVSCSQNTALVYSRKDCVVGAVQFGKVFDTDEVKRAIKDKKPVSALDFV